MLFHSTSGIPVNKHLTMKMHTQNMAENWSSLTKLDKDISMDGAVIKMENEITDTSNIPESQDNSRSCSPADGQSSRDGTGNKALRVDSKICGVCGDKALGNNFNAITCESCKAFFRRNALKPKEFVCPFSNSCKVDPVTRRFCQKCRLKKCFDIGMKKEWIMSPEEKKIKKIKIEQNRKKRQSSDAIPLSCEPPVSKAACMIDPNKYQYQFSQIESHDHLVVVPQNSPPDPTLPHKIAKQPMMPHEEQSPSPSSSFSFQQHQLSPMPMPMTTLPSPSSSFSSASNHSNNSCNNNNPSPNLTSSLNGNFDDSKNSMSSSLISFPNVNDTTLVNIGEQQQQHSLGIRIKSKSNLNTDQIFVEQMHCESSNRNQILNSSNSCSSGPGSSSSSSSSLPLSLWSDSNIGNSSLKIEHGQSQGQEHENGVGDCVVVKDESHLILRGENIGNGNRNGDQSTCQPLPLLASLIRPAGAESPPETQLISEYDHHAGRNMNSVTVITREMDPEHNQEQQQSSPLSFLSGNRNCNYGDTNGLHSANTSGMEATATSAGNNLKQNFSSDSSDDDRSGQSGGGNSNGRTGDVGEISFALNIADMICAGSQSQTNEAHKINDGYQENEQDMMPLPLNTMDSILSVAITAEYNAFSALNGSGLGSGGRGGGGGGSNSKLLNRAEQNKLNELLLASQALNDPVDAEGPVKVSDPSLINVINLTDIAIRRLIKMSKKISGFKNMCQEDQVALLKGSCTEMMILRSVVSYDPDRDSWNIPHSDVGYNIKLGVLKEARGNLYEEHQRFVKSFDGKWRLNENIMMILCAITLFTPERANVIHKDVVKLEQASYYYLLKRYLESFLDGCTARSTYIKLIDRIAQLHRLNTNHLRVFLEVNPREVEPLLIEIFDLK